MKFDLDQFLKDRNEALMSLDEIKIRAYLRKYGEEPPANPTVFWMGVHKAITACTDLPREFRQKSAAWLEIRGSRSMDDGDLAVR
jgi:hypothetical protein